ncbi:hypothetical protein ANCDUO_01552 [Ancylostoma duodenale]|uniref:Uncharacterized protein n=1 Tax=Ancylostoma duodenale TaxID=51022 RepID=A0A0C2H8Z1_9BILA|nr:hypothetical protein ANCDUO_01552 [Ancylostoma duodenale]
MYDEALRSLKLDMALAERSQRPMKEGPIGFLAPRCAAALEKDGLQGGIQTKLAVKHIGDNEAFLHMGNCMAEGPTQRQ